MPLGRRQPDLRAAAAYLLRREVDGEVGGLDDRLFLGRRGAPQGRSQTRHQLVHAERLGDVVVGTGVERGDLVGLGVADGEHDDRYGAPAAQTADDVDTVDPRKPEVEHHHVGMVVRREVERVLAVGRKVDVVPACPQVDPERAQDLRLVVDDQHTGHADTCLIEKPSRDGCRW